MHPTELIKSLYLGDRSCKAVLIDSWKNRIAIQVNVISRLKPGATSWDFYTDRDIADGWLVFSEVSSCTFEPTGPLPNDLINEIALEPLNTSSTDNERFRVRLSIGSVNQFGDSTEISLTIEAAKVHLEDPVHPGVEIQ